MLLTIGSAAFGAALFGAAGWLGPMLDRSWYGLLERETDGPPALAVPQWAFVALPACIGIALGVRGVQPLQAAIALFAVLSLAVCAATDSRTGKLPDLFTLGPLLVVLALSAVGREWTPALGALFAFVPFAAGAAVSRGRGMGWGDVKLAALGGALVGMGGITLAVAVASIGALIAGALRGRMRAPIAFGPFLALAIGAALGLGGLV